MYTKKAGKLYNITGTSKEKCVVKLKRRHITKRADENSSQHAEIDFKLTPFTSCVVNLLPQSQKPSPNKNLDGPSLLTINEVQQDANNQEMLRSLRFVCANLKDADGWADAIQYNVITMSQTIFEGKIHRNKDDTAKKTQEEDTEHDHIGLSPHRSIQRDLVNSIIEDADKNQTKRRTIKCCGYLIRRNHSQQRSFHHQQVYRKPSIAFGVLYASGEIGFYHSHEMKRVADVVACKADLIREKVIVEDVPGSKLGFTLRVGDDIRELFITSDPDQRSVWVKSIQEICTEKEGKVIEEPIIPEKTPVEQQQPVEREAEAIDLSQFGIDSDDEDGGGTVIAHGNNNNCEVYIPGLTGSDDEDDEDGSVIISRKPASEEPNIFGNKKRENIFGNEFWSAPAEMVNNHIARSYTEKSPEPSIHRVDFEDELRNVRQVLANRDKEIDDLKEKLRKATEKLEAALVENSQLKTLLEKK
jgi:hypothetical protein